MHCQSFKTCLGILAVYEAKNRKLWLRFKTGFLSNVFREGPLICAHFEIRTTFKFRWVGGVEIRTLFKF